MRTIFFNIAIICFFTSCMAQDNKGNSDVVGYEKYDKVTIVVIDNLSRNSLPEVLKRFYYNQLQEKDFFEPQSIVNDSNDTRIVELKTKQAEDGYLYICKYTNEFITNNKDVLFVVGQDTINAKEEVLNLVRMKRTEIISVDTSKTKEYALIKIN